MSTSFKHQTDLSRARGLGSAKSGLKHWIKQRLTALLALPLLVWLLYSLVTLDGLGYTAARDWVAAPQHAVPLLLAILLVFTHAALGLQVVIEDYIHKPTTKHILLILNILVAALAAFAGIYAVFRLSFGVL